MLTLITNGHPLNEISIKTLVGYMEFYNIPVRAIYLNGCTKLYLGLIKEVLSLTRDSMLVGFSLMSKDVKVLMPLVKKIREEQHKPVIWGGIHPTALPRKSLEHCDFICLGEGEEPLRRLYQNIAGNRIGYSDIPNIGYHDKDCIRINPVTYSVESLDDLPFPDYKFSNSYFLQGFREGRKLEKIPEAPSQKGEFFRTDSFMFYSQRGCRLACTYCSNSLYHRLAKTTGVKWYRVASVKRIKEELQSHLEQLPFVEQISLNDDDILDRDVDELRALAVFLKDDLNVTFTVNATPSHVTRDKIAVLAENGLSWLGMGVQSGSEKILKHVYERPVTNSQVINAANIISEFYKVGVKANYGFILDNPYETNEDLRQTLRLLMSLPKPRAIVLYSLAFFPGTVLTKRALENGYIKKVDEDIDKMYHDDIKATYPYFLFHINARFNIPDWLNSCLLSDFMYRNAMTAALRVILGKTTLLLKAKSKVKDWLKLALTFKLELTGMDSKHSSFLRYHHA